MGKRIFREGEGKEDCSRRWMDSANMDSREKMRNRAVWRHVFAVVVHSRAGELFDGRNIVGSLLAAQNEPVEDESCHTPEYEVIQRAKHCHGGGDGHVRHLSRSDHHQNYTHL